MRKKIAFVVATPYTAKAFLYKHFEVLSADYDVYLIANFEGFDSDFLKNFPNVTTYHVPIVRSIQLLKDIKALFLLIKYFNKMKFDAIHSVTPKAGLTAMIAGKLTNIKNRVHVFTGQVWHTKTGFFKKTLMFLDVVIAKSATQILVDGHSQQQYLISHKIISKKNSSVLAKGSISGVNLTKFVIDSSLREKVRNELKYSNTDVVFVFLGRINTDKGVLDLSKAFQKIQLEFSNAKLLIVGPDEENLIPTMLEIVTNHNAVLFTGHTNTPLNYLNAANVFCMPSYREGFGTSVIEASLMNLPVICSDTYGLMDTIIDKETGIRHKVKDENSIYNAMKTLLCNENLRILYGKNGANYVKDNFSAEYVSAEWLRFYKNLLD